MSALDDTWRSDALALLLANGFTADDAATWANIADSPHLYDPAHLAASAVSYRDRRVPPSEAVIFHGSGVSAALAHRYRRAGWSASEVARLRILLMDADIEAEIHGNAAALTPEMRMLAGEQAWLALGLPGDWTLRYVAGGVKRAEVPKWEQERRVDEGRVRDALDMMAGFLT